ncbi:MAG: DsbE family thiol:disulfide interchange protein [Rhodospirillales bacterium]|nr:DsbE family thiol:disulfide interchange protein [Rhodospirillales bacterium]
MSETTGSATRRQTTGKGGRRLLFAVPVIGFVVLAVALALGLGRDPGLVPSVLIGAPAPETALPPVDGHGPGFSAADFEGQVTLVNVFASWCTSCIDEHPLLMKIAANTDVALFGLAYKDDPQDTANWLARHGNPFDATAADIAGRAGIDWGVYGVPETFVVGPDGKVVYKHIGPISPESWSQTILPLIDELRT